MSRMDFEYIKVSQLMDEKYISTISPSFKLQNDDIVEFGTTPVISQDKVFISGYTNLIDKKLSNPPYIIFGDHTEILKFVKCSFAQGADGIKILKTDGKTIDSSFLYYALVSCYYRTGFYERHFKLLKKTYIPNLSFNYQQKIATILNNYDRLIENNNKRIKLLEDMAESLYKEWLLKTEYENKPLKNILSSYFNGGWGNDVEAKEHSNLGYVIRGTDIPDIKDSNYNDIPARYHSNNDILNKQLKSSDIILELSNGNIDNVGRTLLITENLIVRYGKVMCASFCKVLRFNNDEDSLSVLFFINFLQKTGRMSFYKNTGTNGINNFNFKRFLRQQMPILNNSTLSKLKKMIEMCDTLRRENYSLKLQRDSLLPRLMSGKLSVEGKEII